MAMANKCTPTRLVMVVVLSIVAVSTLDPMSAALHRPDGGQDGLYEAFVDQDGAQQVNYLGKGNTTVGSDANGSSHRRSGGGWEILDTVHCGWADVMDSSDVAYAVAGLANHFGCGTAWDYNYAFYWGSGVAFACNYGFTQHTTATQVYSDQDAVTEKCGADSGGWYSRESWKSSFGRTKANLKFC